MLANGKAFSGFSVNDLDVARKFYEEVLGLGTREKYEGTLMATDASGIFRGQGPVIAWFKDPAGNVMSVIDQADVAAGAGQQS